MQCPSAQLVAVQKGLRYQVRMRIKLKKKTKLDNLSHTLLIFFFFLHDWVGGICSACVSQKENVKNYIIRCWYVGEIQVQYTFQCLL